jgi:hypothetical protein
MGCLEYKASGAEGAAGAEALNHSAIVNAALKGRSSTVVSATETIKMPTSGNSGQKWGTQFLLELLQDA